MLVTSDCGVPNGSRTCVSTRQVVDSARLTRRAMRPRRGHPMFLFCALLAIGCDGAWNDYGYSADVVRLGDGNWHEQQSQGTDTTCTTTWKRFRLAPPPDGLEEIDVVDLPCSERPRLRQVAR